MIELLLMSNPVLAQNSPSSQEEIKRSTSKRGFVFFALALLAVNISMIIWSLFDHSLPVYDMACHILSGFACCDLLQHIHLRSMDWWQQLLAVNPLYPPFVYFIYGTFKLLLGPQHWVDSLVRLTFANILFFSVYGLGKILFKDKNIALMSSLLVFCAPIVFNLTHYDMLDIPGLAMVSLAIFCLAWWQEQPSILSSLSLGVGCALAALTKNNCIAFLVAPLLISLIQAAYTKNWLKIRLLVLAGATAFITMLPWLTIAAPTMFKMVGSYQQKKYNYDLISSANYYIFGLPALVSYFLFAMFLIVLCTAPTEIHKRLFLVMSSILGGLSVLILFPWNEQIRYALPAAIPIALYTAWGFKHYWTLLKTRGLIVIAALTLAFAFIENNFTPYPLPRIQIPWQIAGFIGIEPARKDEHHGAGGTSMYPTPPADWGYSWVIDTIKPHLGSTKQQFCIMPDCEEVSSTIYSYLVRCNNLNLHAFTPRNWTMIGDDVSFNQKTALFVHWYLLKTGSNVSPASHFSGKASEEAYIQWCNFVRNSGHFKLIGTKLLPDNTQLELYKNSSY